jgi:hypothetical protein
MKKVCFILMLFLISAGMFVFNSCSKDVASLEDNSQPFKIENGILYFKNRCSFESTMYYLHSKKTDELENWESEIGFSNSLRSFYQNADFDREELIEDLFFASVLNKDGLFAIGDTLHRISFKNEYVTSIDNLELLLKTDDNLNNAQISDKIKIFPISRKINNLKSVGGNLYEDVDSPCDIDWIKARLHYWCVNTLAYNTIGIKITGRQKRYDSCTGSFKDEVMNYGKVEGTTWYKVW